MVPRKRGSLVPRAIVATCILGVGALVAAILIRDSLTELVESIALEQTERYAIAIDEFRTLYTSEVVVRAQDAGVRVTHDYKRHTGAIPLPATLGMMFGERLTDSNDGGGVRLYSAHPFPWHGEEGGPKNDFERDALEILSRSPDRTFHRFEQVNGVSSVRVATADLLRAECVSCHNSHPDSPKTDWKEGDVRGVLAVTVPLTRALAQTQAASYTEFTGQAVLIEFFAYW